MAAAASTALLRSVATKLARRPGPGPVSSLSRRFSSSPAGASTPPPTNNNKDAPQNKIDLKEFECTKATVIKVAAGVVKFLAFGSAIYMCVVVIPAVSEFRESFDALDRKISKMQNNKERQ